MCKSGGFEIIPKSNTNLNLPELAKRFENVKLKTKVMLVAEVDNIRTIIYPSGRILLHGCDEEKGQEIATKIYRMIRESETSKRG